MFGKRQRRISRIALVGVVIALAGSATVLAATRTSVGAASQTAPAGLRAFQRPARPDDAIPVAFVRYFRDRWGGVSASRRIATATTHHGHAALYLVRFKRHYTCMIQIYEGGAGAGCSPSRTFVSTQRPVNPGTGDRLFHGVAANEIARVAFVDPHGHLHTVRLTRDGGFIYACRHRNGCADLIMAVNGYNRRGRLVYHEAF